MSDRLKALRENRGTIIKTAREILDLAEGEKRDLSDEESAKHDEIMDEVGKLGKRIEREEHQLELDRKAAETRAADPEPGQGAGDPGSRGDGKPPSPRATPEYRAAFTRYLIEGREGLSPEEYRALQADDDVVGGYLVVPEEFKAELIKFVDDMVFIRPLATIHQLSKAASLGVPSLDTDVSDADWTTEIKAVSEDTAMKFGKRELTPHPLSKLVKVSEKLIRTSAVSAETIVRDRLGYKFGVTEEKGFLTGSGAAQPLGVFTASADGISTSRDVSTGNTTTSIAFDGLMEAKYSLKGQYWNRATWIFHRDALKQIAKLKDGEGRYQWEASVKVGQPDRLLNLPFHMSEYAPSTFTTGLYVGILGDFSFYWIVEALNFSVQRLVELYAATNQIGFIGRAEVDAMPVLEEAFARVKLA